MDINVGPTTASAGWKTPLSMVLVQLFNTGMILLSKVSIGGGMFIFSLLAYRSFFGAVFILPFALVYERGKWRDMSWRAFGFIFFNAFIGMETMQICSAAGSLKIVGVFLSVGGTMLISLYKGKTLHLWSPIFEYHKDKQLEVASNQLRGTIILVASSFAFACWYIIQSKVLKVYPHKYWSSMLTCLVGGFQTALVGIILRTDKSAWKLGWDLNLVTILYSGALATAARYSLNSWVVAKRGPAYPPMFSPLSVVFTVVLSSVFIGDHITIGSILGTTTVIVGLYVFLWAKSKEVWQA
nr:WAT1-related protein At5g64700-like isoform X3 [Lolium perenne]